MSVAIDLTGKRLLVVGGSAGIGRAVTISAGRAGALIAVVGRRAERLEEVVQTIGSGTAIAADVRDADECARLVDEAAAALGGFDAVVISVGVSNLAELDSLDARVWHDIMTTNTIAPALVTKAALPSMVEDGVIMFLSSITVGGGHHGLGVYGASKAALDRTVRTWRMERPDKRFVCVAVGDTFGTEFSRDFDLEKAAELFPKWVASGVLYQERMEADDLGRGLAELLAMLFAHPGYTIPELMITPPGGMFAGTAEDVVASIAENQP